MLVVKLKKKVKKGQTNREICPLLVQSTFIIGDAQGQHLKPSMSVAF